MHLDERSPLKRSTESEANIACRVGILATTPNTWWGMPGRAGKGLSYFCLPFSLRTNWWSQPRVSTSLYVRVHHEHSLVERIRTQEVKLKASFPFSSVCLGKSWLGLWGKRTRGREDMAPATFPTIPGFWLKRKTLLWHSQFARSKCTLIFEEPRTRVSQKWSRSELLTPKLKLHSSWIHSKCS